MSLDVVVINYHTPHDLQAFLRSFVQFGPTGVDSTLTVIEVDSNDGDRSESYEVETDDGQLVRASKIHLSSNVGYGRACNLAASCGEADVIALFNADVVLRAGVLTHCHNALMSHQDWGVLGPRQVDEQRKIVHAGIFGTNERPRHRGWKNPDHGQFADRLEAITVSGSAYFVKRELWEELWLCELYRELYPSALGAFLPTPHYYEETWCSYHARAHGWKVMYDGTVTVQHGWHKASPVGGWAEEQMKVSQQMFRDACDHHNILRD